MSEEQSASPVEPSREPAASRNSTRKSGAGPSVRSRTFQPCASNPCVTCRATGVPVSLRQARFIRSEEHTSELQSLMRISYAVFCLKKKHQTNTDDNRHT